MNFTVMELPYPPELYLRKATLLFQKQIQTGW